jgi:predicted acetyltransferase
MRAKSSPCRLGLIHNGPVPNLVAPTERVHASYLVAVADFQIHGAHIDLDVGELRDVATFRRYVDELIAQAEPDTPRPTGYVPETVLWWVDGAAFLGRLSIRHQLTEALTRVGGHIGYEVAPAARRRGHATAMLGAALPIASRLGIDPVLITCDRDNIASRRVIEHHGGRPDAPYERTLRFWVPTKAVT